MVLGLLAVSVALLSGQASPAVAFSGQEALPCRLYFGDTGEGISPSEYSDTFTLEVSPAAASVGTSVDISVSATTGPRSGPIALGPDSFAIVITLDISGAESGTLTFDNGVNDYPATATPAFGLLGPYEVSTQFTPTVAGSVALSLQQVKLDDGRYGGGSGANADTYCSGLPGDRDHKAEPATSETITSALTVDEGTCANTQTPVTDELRTITVDGQARSFYVSTPVSPAPEAEPLPVVFNLHGTGGNGLGGQISFMREQGPERGYVVISPNATIRPGTTTTGWAKIGEPSPDEIAFLEAILVTIRDVACIDDQRIFADGHSNGAIFSTELACRWNKVAAIAPWSGVSSANPARCSSRPVPLITTHGTADEFTFYDGDSRPDPDLPDGANYQGSVPIDVDYWAYVTNQCDSDSRETTNPVPGVELTSYSGCAAETVLYTVIDGGHVAFSKTRTPPDPIDSAELALDFFDRQVRIDGPDYVPPPPPPVNLPPLLATVPPTLSITPVGPYSDGDEVTITGSGFSAFRAVAVSICKRGKVVSGPGSCMFVDRSQLVTSDAEGGFTTTLEVMVGAINTAGDLCGPDDACDFTAIALARACELTQTAVLFAGGTPPGAPPTPPGCPRLTLSSDSAEPGQAIDVTGAAFPPGAQVSLATYFQWPAVGQPSGDAIVVTADQGGEFLVRFVAPRIATGIGAFEGAPGEDSFLYTAARFLAPADVLTNPPGPNPTPSPAPTPTPSPTPSEAGEGSNPPESDPTPGQPASPDTSPTSGDVDTSSASGGTLPATGANTGFLVLVGVALIQVSLILIVRSVRSVPVRRYAHQ
jgi:poly(3-hydroxybutyrate) depolymerase